MITLQALDLDLQKCYNEYTKGTTAPIQGVGQYEDRNPPSNSPKYTRVGFTFLFESGINENRIAHF